MKKILALLIFISVSCTKSHVARNLGGSYSFELQKDNKLINITWKQNSLWVLTRKMNKNDIPESYEFKEHSSVGILEGIVTIIEKK